MKKKSESSARGQRHRGNANSTKKARPRNLDDLRPEYDFSAMNGGVRGKYAKRVRAASNIVVLEPDIAKAFPTENAVNQALRRLLEKTPAVRHRS